jgi:hypothetical protein
MRWILLALASFAVQAQSFGCFVQVDAGRIVGRVCVD